MLSHSELFLHWAAEEFVAAGRAPDARDRQTHRDHALFFSDVFRELDKIEFIGPPAKRPEEVTEIGQLLAQAFPLADVPPRS